MTDKPYDDPETLARLRLTGNDGEKMTYGEMAEELDCSTGIISLRMNRYEDEIAQYSKNDFTPDRLSSPHSDDQRDVMFGTIEKSLPQDSEIGQHKRRIYSESGGVEVHVPGNYLEDSIQVAMESEYDEVYVAVYISNINERVLKRIDGLDDVNLLVCRPGSAVAKFCESEHFETAFISP